MRKILLLILTCLIAGISFSQTAVQPSNLWTDKFTNDENYAASYCIASDDLNHVYNAIASEGTLLRAFDTEGEVLYSVNIEGISFPSDIIADSDNNWLYINGNPDHSLCKIDKSSGDVIWVEKLNTNSSSWGSTYAMTLDTEGNIIIVGTESGLGYRVIKFDSDANTLFDETFTVEGFSIPRGVTCDADNNIILTGEYDGSKTALLKVSSEGVLVWEVLDPSKPGANGVLVDQNNDIVITGSSLSSGIQFIHKYDADGNNVWKKTGYEDYTGFGIIEDAQGNYIVAGDHTTNAATWQGEQAITCYSSDGEILWNHT
ncbi:MAG TPA: hypothetical protein DG754_11860, partial [Bacteroidales bacterium]|nr:hypothetical protein [Bacteroidales bacterium]